MYDSEAPIRKMFLNVGRICGILLVGDALMLPTKSEDYGSPFCKYPDGQISNVSSLHNNHGRQIDLTRKKVLWIHLHNFGGTFICSQAIAQGETTNDFSPQGCFIPGEGCCTQDNRATCQKRSASKFSFTMAERDVDDNDMCGDLLFGTILRDPLAACRSTLVANQFNKKELMKVLRSGNAGPVAHQPCLPGWDSYQHFDNYVTRSLGDAYLVPPRQVTRAHLEKAKARLQKMDVLMIMQDMSEQMVQLEATFGWDLSLIHPQQRVNQHKTGAVFTTDEASFLVNINALDYELYRFGTKLAEARTAKAKAAVTQTPATAKAKETATH